MVVDVDVQTKERGRQKGRSKKSSNKGGTKGGKKGSGGGKVAYRQCSNCLECGYWSRDMSVRMNGLV